MELPEFNEILQERYREEAEIFLNLLNTISNTSTIDKKIKILDSFKQMSAEEVSACKALMIRKDEFLRSEEGLIYTKEVQKAAMMDVKKLRHDLRRAMELQRFDRIKEGLTEIVEHLESYIEE